MAANVFNGEGIVTDYAARKNTSAGRQPTTRGRRIPESKLSTKNKAWSSCCIGRGKRNQPCGNRRNFTRGFRPLEKIPHPLEDQPLTEPPALNESIEEGKPEGRKDIGQTFVSVRRMGSAEVRYAYRQVLHRECQSTERRASAALRRSGTFSRFRIEKEIPGR